eukprot:7004724-Prymnesium_polylepis.1
MCHWTKRKCTMTRMAAPGRSTRRDEGNAFSGSGGDVWYKVGLKLVGLCTRLDAEANALVASLASPDPVADTLHASMEAASREIQDIETEIRRAKLVMDGLVALKDKSVEKTRTLRERLATCKLECLSALCGNAEAYKRPRLAR